MLYKDKVPQMSAVQTFVALLFSRYIFSKIVLN